MKKGLLVLLTVSMIAAMTACGSSEETESQEESAETEEASVEESTATAIECTDAVYKGMTYSYPKDWDFQESDDSVTITSTDGMTMIMIMSLDVTEDYGVDDDVEGFLDLTISSMTSGYEDIQITSSQDGTLAGATAKQISGMVTSNSLDMNYEGLALYYQGIPCIYALQYFDMSGFEENLAGYQAFYNSISFDPDLVDESEFGNETAENETASDESVPSEYVAALNSAESYNKSLHMSKQGLYDQLTSEYGGKFDEDAAQYAVDNIDADWDANALATAESYNNTLHLSKQGMFDQLVSDHGGKFTEEEAQYAIDNIDADWNANALASAKSYRDTLDMSSSKIHDQLTSEYGGKFTEEEADYAIEHLDD